MEMVEVSLCNGFSAFGPGVERVDRALAPPEVLGEEASRCSCTVVRPGTRSTQLALGSDFTAGTSGTA